MPITAPYYPATVLIHSAEEQEKFLKALEAFKLVGWSDFGEVPEGDMVCTACGNPVNEHSEGKCPHEVSNG